MLHIAIRKLGWDRYEPVLVDYCPDEFGFDDPHFTDETYQILNARLQSEIDYEVVHTNIAAARKESIRFLKMELELRK